MSQVNVLEMSFRQGEAEVEKLQEILGLIHAEGNTFWASAEAFLEEGFDHSLCYLENCREGIDLNGNLSGNLEGEYTIVPFDEWYRAAKAYITGQNDPVVPVATIENAAFLNFNTEDKDLQKLLDICARHGISFWGDARDYSQWTRTQEHVTFFDEGTGIDGSDQLTDDQVLVSFDAFYELLKNHFGEVIKSVDEAPVRNPRPRYRKRARQKPKVAKTIVRVLYTTQQVYTFKNVHNVQIIDDKVFIQHEREITEGIKESSESEINGDLVMAVVIHEPGNRSNFFRNIDGTWDFQAENGTVVNSGKQLGRVFKK